MGISNVINEELSRMKSLFGYQRGKVVSEQNQGSNVKNNTMSTEDRQFYVNKEYCSQKNGVVPKRNVGGYFDIPAHKFSDTVKIYKITDAEIKAAQATCPDVKMAQTTFTSQPPQPTPTELKDANGVKAFQDWLDKNKAGWATGYANGVLNKTGTGYGRMGPRTSKAWASYKDEYLKGGQQTQSTNPYDGYTSDNTDSTAKSQGGVEGDDNTTQNTNTQPSTTVQKTAQPPSEPGQSGETRDGWSWDEKQQKWY